MPSASARREQARRRRRPRPGLIDPGYRYEYLDPGSVADDPGVAATTASARGAGPIGFAGTARHADAAPAGLTTLGGAAPDADPGLPLLPSSWSHPTEEGSTAQVDDP
ncbi:hypothetical protein A5646_20135 [Mycobacterium sp. 1245499.0]|uniref:PPW family C-terminal domain-containing PPE protein n=1 Tax=unclassified Mycobacterium TaxID=2642494 RepID=UPI0007FE6EE4|nr:MULTISPECIES: hypothetical protein [unclassified Mycobacterium]OBJ18966.1 hypothetical protein A5622_21320 [Mycobacterium sp. 1245801.1]OBL01077.1 hypothetical protein A5646_20135 [Mycobacterium sp. 1245499.0]